MARITILDLFCGAGGASMGLYRAGFEVIGVDIIPQPNYPFEFYEGDAMDFPLTEYDAFWASPPCQAYSCGGTIESRAGHPKYIEPIRERLELTGKPYIIENVVGAPLIHPTMLCGDWFNLKVIRHRLFECNFPVIQPPHPKHRGKVTDGDYHGIYTGGRPGCFGDNVKRYKLKVGTTDEWSDAMDIHWMDRYELTQAIPPAYAEYIGRYLIKYLGELQGRDG